MWRLRGSARRERTVIDIDMATAFDPGVGRHRLPLTRRWAMMAVTVVIRLGSSQLGVVAAA